MVMWSKFINAYRKVCHPLREEQGTSEIASNVLPEMALPLPAVPVR